MMEDIAHEIWAVSQLLPNEGIEDAVSRINEILREHTYQQFLIWRGINSDDVCQVCDGSGVRVYGSTALWGSGIGGQMMTNGICDECWGTGKKSERGVDLRKLRGQT